LKTEKGFSMPFAMLSALLLVVFGLLLVFGGIIFALINMGRNFGRSAEGSFFRMLTGHLRSMFVMAIGGLLFFIGIIIAVVEIVSRVF